MTSEGNTEEKTSHHPSTPAGGVISVDNVETSTNSTQEAQPHKPQQVAIMPPKREEASEGVSRSRGEQHQQTESQEENPPMVVVTEGGPSETTKVAEDAGDAGSVVSMPAAVPSAAGENVEGEGPTGNMMSPSDSDAASVASAPAVVVDVDGEIGSSELEDIMSSPHGNNAIVERSPGGRYVRFMEKLGSGASKDVYRAYDTQEGIEVAWNVVHLAGVPKNERNRIVNEVRLLERLHHHNIISFHGSWVNREKQQVNFVTEILSSGTLQSFINKVQVIRWKIAKRWALQILKGLEYLHSQSPPVIHRDLKCENIFINGTSGDLRIGDLGLSTVHRNGRALSVLGTPEFMAPDMYEESAYDEKVDIYAFGMCLLEIFTKEIPYQECSNPAQIYKKVTRGDPPDSLRRLKSRHAREFIYLCLGTKDEEGNYLRPSATELIAHPFLQQRPSDDDEVGVEAPMQEKTIREVPETSSTGVKGVSRSVRSQSSRQVEGTTKNASSSPMSKADYRTTLEEEDSDRFNEMPDSETSFRKPKVLMGRGQELHRENDARPPTNERQGSGVVEGDSQAHLVPASSGGAAAAPEQNVPTPAQSPASAFHFLVAAAVIEDETANSQPYEDDVLKLIVTLPVEGQTQNVQFDFHLVEDDPIQVAKEMVAELGIPQAAVLEISETISGLARAARIKQDKYIARMKKPQGHRRTRSQSQGCMPQGHETVHSEHQTVGHGTNMMQSQSHQSIPDYMSAPARQGQQAVQSLQQQQGIAQQDQSQHALGQPMGQHASMPAMHVPQHQAGGDSASSLPLNPAPLPNAQVQPVGQPVSLDQTMHPVAGHMGQGQHQQGQHQQAWQQHLTPNTTPGAQPPSDAPVNGQQSYGHGSQVPDNAPNVRRISGSAPPNVSAPGPAYGHPNTQQAPMPIHAGRAGVQQGEGQGSYGKIAIQHASVRGQQQGQHGGEEVGEGRSGGYDQASMHHAQPNGQQNQNGGRQNVENQNQYNQISNQQHGQFEGQQNMDAQRTYIQYSQMQHATMPNHEYAQNGAQQGGEGQEAYNQAPTQPAEAHGEEQQRHQQQQIPARGQASEGQSQASAAYMNPPQQSRRPPQQPQRHGIGQGMQVRGKSSNLAETHPTPLGEVHSHSQCFQGSAMGSNHATQNRQPSAGQQMEIGHKHDYGHALPSQQRSSQSQSQQQQQLHPVSQQSLQASSSNPPQHQHQPVLVNRQEEPSAPGMHPTAGPSSVTIDTSATVPMPVSVQNSMPIDSSSVAASEPQVVPLDNHINGVRGVPYTEEDNALDELLAAELRKLDEDFQRNMMRAQKVFDTRMDNLARSQVQREAQHQKTLEKHQKERADFEKRRQQEEIEQNRRIEQLREEWANRREAMRQKQLAEAHAVETVRSTSPAESSGTIDDGDSSGQ